MAGVIRAAGLRAIERYRGSELAARSRGCCRYTPTCSHYAEQALLHRALPMAVLLIVRRVLTCRARVPLGTLDPLTRRTWSLRKFRAVLLLALITTFGTAGLAQAVRPALLTATTTLGGCTMTINGGTVGSFDRNHPLVVHKGQRLLVKGLAPQRFRNAPEPPGANTTFALEIRLIDPYAYTDKFPRADGFRTFDSIENVDDYLSLGSGLYRINASASGFPVQNGVIASYDCSATFYVKMDGNDLPGLVGGAIALAGLAGGATSGGKTDWAPEDSPPVENDPGNDFRPPDKLLVDDVSPDTVANQKADAFVLGCLAVIAAYLGITGGGELAMAATVGLKSSPEGRSFRRRGHPVRGFISGLLAGLGATVFMQQRGYWVLGWENAVGLPIALALLFGWRGWRGKAFRVTSTPRAAVPPAEPA